MEGKPEVTPASSSVSCQPTLKHQTQGSNNLYHLEACLRVSSVRPKYEGVVLVQHRAVDHVLLCPLIFYIMAKLTTEGYLRVIMDITSNKKLAALMVQRISTETRREVKLFEVDI